MLRHVQTLEGRILVTPDEYRRHQAQQKRLAPRVLTDKKGRTLDASRLRRLPEAPPRPPPPPRAPGQRISLMHVELPKPPFRWTPGRKALVVTAVRSGQISFAEACGRFEITRAEMVDWMCLAAGGEKALRITKRPEGSA